MNIARDNSDEASVRALIEAWESAVHRKDADEMMRHYAPEVVSFDVVDGLQTVGFDACRKRAEEWTSGFEGPVGFELRHLDVRASGDIAFGHSLNHVHGTGKDGSQIDMWLRATLCFEKRNGQWFVTHEHISVPFATNSGKPMLDAAP